MSSFLRANIRAMAGYTPGEQPRDGDLHQAQHQREPLSAVAAQSSKRIAAALTGDRLRKYPDPLATGLPPDGRQRSWASIPTASSSATAPTTS